MGDSYTDGRFARLRDLSEFLEGIEKPVLLVEGIRSLPDSDTPLLRQLGALLSKRLPGLTFRTGSGEFEARWQLYKGERAAHIGMPGSDPASRRRPCPFASLRLLLYLA